MLALDRIVATVGNIGVSVACMDTAAFNVPQFIMVRPNWLEIHCTFVAS